MRDGQDSPALPAGEDALRAEVVRLRARVAALEHVLRGVDEWATSLELYAWPEDQLVPALQRVRDVLEPRPWH